MAITFKWRLSYQNEVEYEVFGHPTVTRIEVYSYCRHGLLEFQFRDFNGGPEEFRRYMVARQGGLKVEWVNDRWSGEASYWANRRVTRELYDAFVAWQAAEHSAYLVKHEARRVELGWTREEYPVGNSPAIPRPIYWCPEFHGYLTEPWYGAQPDMRSEPPTEG
jgi:hypothetical protein